MSISGWTPGIGDPTVIGWLTVFAYAVAALCCWLASRRTAGRERGFWLFLTAVLAFLCVNKELDLQSLMTAVLRERAKADGWYAERGLYQEAFIGGMVFAGMLGAAVVIRVLRRTSLAAKVASVGLAVLGTFVLIRASSFHHVDQFIGFRLAGMKMNHLLELGGIAVVTAGALAARDRGRTRRRR